MKSRLLRPKNRSELTALVHGTGFAGRGHVAALRAAGVTVSGIVGRTPEVVARVAHELEVPFHSTDWAAALRRRDPAIVCIATPGGAHLRPVEQALARGCHVFCDKPLEATASRAVRLAALARQAHCETAYAATQYLQPSIRFMRRCLEQGWVGVPQEVECLSHFNINPLIPAHWSHRLADGGGRLNNNFTHKLAIIEYLTGAVAMATWGESRNDLKRAPRGGALHDFRDRDKLALSPAQARQARWEAVDAEWSYTVAARLRRTNDAERDPVSVLFKHSGLQPAFAGDHIVIYGSEGALAARGAYGAGPILFRSRNRDWTECAVPKRVTRESPDLGDPVFRNWAHLMKDFVAAIRGERHEAFPTFDDGARYQEIIAATRRGESWRATRRDIARAWQA